jgi:putative CocE/NonD family hydrolase
VKVVHSFPRRVRVIEHAWIPLQDGCRLAARIWLPEDAERDPVPALVEYIPYGKRAGTRERDEPMHGYFAGHGYAALRIDLRGSGESDGLLLDEYLPQEQDDGVEALAWVAAQPWCSGAVGLIGKSWGGFNALQIAARRPPALRAIVTVCSTDDRYADDAHYMGGCLLLENLFWGSAFFTLTAESPDPALVGEGWRERWRERLLHAAPHPATWLRHPRRDAYWKHGSVCEDYTRIACPVYAVGGWADAYSNAVPRLLAGLSGARLGLVGPWGHVYPHAGTPGPAIGFLQEALRWFDPWLRGADLGMHPEPRYRVWMQEPPEPGAGGVIPGRWVAEDTWPSPRIQIRPLALGAGRLDPVPGRERALELSSPQSVGSAAGSWLGFWGARDQREDDARSLVFDSAPLPERIEILGAPVVILELTADRPYCLVAVRLNDVAPGGAALRVSYGLLNLTHRAGHERPEPLRPGRRVRVRIPLGDAAHAFLPGHQIRLALSTSYWPVAWPSPERVTLRVYTGASRVELPVRPPAPGDGLLRRFAEPEAAPGTAATVLTKAVPERRVGTDPQTGKRVVSARLGFDAAGRPARTRLDAIELETADAVTIRLAIHDDDPLSAEAEIRQVAEAQRGRWQTRVVSSLRLRADRETFHLAADLAADEGDDRIFSRRWDEAIPRDGV